MFSLRICQSLYDVKPKVQSEQCVPYRAFGYSVFNGQLLYETARNEGRVNVSKNHRASLFNEALKPY
jgi:hypothetical protein